MRIPRLLWELCHAWDFQERQTAALVSALDQTRWVRPLLWKAALAQYAGRGWRGTDALVQEACTPLAVLTVVEDLVGESTLPRDTAKVMERRILDHVGAMGHWRGLRRQPTTPLWAQRYPSVVDVVLHMRGSQYSRTA